MTDLIDLEKKINSELTTKINKTEIKHDQLYIEIDKSDLIDVTLFIKTNKYTKFRQLIDITAVDYPEQSQRFKLVYLLNADNDPKLFFQFIYIISYIITFLLICILLYILKKIINLSYKNFFK